VLFGESKVKQQWPRGNRQDEPFKSAAPAANSRALISGSLPRLVPHSREYVPEQRFGIGFRPHFRCRQIVQLDLDDICGQRQSG
jgi:hypothetical protein